MHTTRMEKFSKITTILKFNKSERSLESSTTMKRQIMANLQFLIDQWLSWRITPGMRESGSLTKISVRAKEDKFGPMDLCMKAGGWITKPTAREDSFTQMVMFMMVSGSMIKPTDLVFTAIWTVPNTKVTGKKTNSTVKVLKLGQMVLDMKVNTFKEKSMVKASLLGLMALLTTESL